MKSTILLLPLLAWAYAEEATKPSDIYSESEREVISKNQETHEFKAEVNRLMEIIIHSLYSKREVFIRELISNSADALDKIRFLSLTNKDLLDDDELDIRIKVNKTARTISIADNGVGMTKEDLIKNLGVVAKSGTSEFLQAAASGADTLTLIGQFGVGFYSVYLVSDKVTVISKHNNDEQHIWESTANAVFTVAKDPRGNTLGKHGTEIVLHLKEDAEEFLSDAEMEKYIIKYSQFINFPIRLWKTKTVQREVPVEQEPKKQESTDELEVEDDADVEETPKTKTISEEVSDWEQVNVVKAIWTRSPKEIKEEEYVDFYKSLSRDTEGPLAKIHFVAEGEVTFRSILYIPKKAAFGLYDKLYEKSTALKLYVRRVLISEEFEDLLPKYMNFIRGIVDSDDLPLNVSRETLAQDQILKLMSKKLTRKVLDLLRKLSEAEDSSREKEDEEEEKEDQDDEPVDPKAYATFWKEFGKSIKLGVIQDRKNKSKLTKLLRFVTSKSDGKPVSLESYLDRMKENQKKIYYVTGENIEKVKSSPAVERLLKLDYEVIYMVDPLDEYVTQSVTEFEGVDLQSAAKEDLKFGDEDENQLKAWKEEFSPLTDWLKTALSGKIEKAVVSTRLTSSPVVLVTSQYGWSGNMERIMKAQTLQNEESYSYQLPKKTLEINPRHPIVLSLKEKVATDPDEKSLKDLALLLYDTALVQNGFMLDDPNTFAKIVTRVVSLGLGVDPDATIEDTPRQESHTADKEEL